MGKIKSKGIRIASILLIMGLLGGCSNGTTDAPKDSGNKGSSEDKGGSKESKSLTMAGSTSMEKLANAASEAFMEKYPGTIVHVEFIGSSAGVEQVLAGTVNIGNASRDLKDSEKQAGAIENIVAIDGIAVITDKANTVEDLTKEELIGVFNGTIRNWKELGGSDLPIVVVGREAGSGTRGAFEELLDAVDSLVYANEINSSGGVIAKVASTPGAIGYVSLDIVDDTVKGISLEGYAPTVENVKSGSYLLSRPFVMATKGEISEQSDLVKKFFDFLKSDEGKELIQKTGLVTVD